MRSHGMATSPRGGGPSQPVPMTPPLPPPASQFQVRGAAGGFGRLSPALKKVLGRTAFCLLSPSVLPPATQRRMPLSLRTFAAAAETSVKRAVNECRDTGLRTDVAFGWMLTAKQPSTAAGSAPVPCDRRSLPGAVWERSGGASNSSGDSSASSISSEVSGPGSAPDGVDLFLSDHVASPMLDGPHCPPSLLFSNALVLSGGGGGGLGAQWQLKMGITLQSFWASGQRRVGNTFIGALCNASPCVSTWGGLLMSIAVWWQVWVLPRHPSHVVCSAMVCAVNRALKPPWDAGLTLQWVFFIAPSSSRIRSLQPLTRGDRCATTPHGTVECTHRGTYCMCQSTASVVGTRDGMQAH